MSEIPSKKHQKRERHHRNTIQRAIDGRAEKIRKGKLSLPSGAGRLAIIASNAVDHNSLLDRDQQRDAVRDLAYRIKEERAGQHRDVSIHPASKVETQLAFWSPDVTDIVLIGHGNIGDFWMSSGDGHLGWRDVAKWASSLKRGTIEQRSCGNFREGDHVSVPLGTFGVEDQSLLRAATGEVVEDIADDSKFVPIYDKNDVTLEDIVSLNILHGVTAQAKLGDV